MFQYVPSVQVQESQIFRITVLEICYTTNNLAFPAKGKMNMKLKCSFPQP